MDAAPLVLAVGAGALAVLNPCGFALLPAWLALLVASVAFAVGWAHEFYVPHHLGRAAVLLAWSGMGWGLP